MESCYCTIKPVCVLKANLYMATKGNTQEQFPYYDGDYLITPKTKEQVLETKNKKMNDNLFVLAIPYHAVGNQSGTTVIIGE